MFPEPIIFLGIPIHLFGVFAALSILLGYWVTASEMKRLGIPIHFLADLKEQGTVPRRGDRSVGFVVMR